MAGRKHQAKRLVQWARFAPGSLREETGEECRTEERTEGDIVPEPESPAEAPRALGAGPSRLPARQGYEPHCTLAPRSSRCKMEYFMK